MNEVCNWSSNGLPRPPVPRFPPNAARVVATGVVAAGIVLFAALISSVAHAKDLEFERDDDNEQAIEEIVVIGERAGDESGRIERLATDALRARILREISQHELLEEEFDRLQEGMRNGVTRPRVRWGYDPRDELHHSLANRQTELPFELFRPAPVCEFHF